MSIGEGVMRKNLYGEVAFIIMFIIVLGMAAASVYFGGANSEGVNDGFKEHDFKTYTKYTSEGYCFSWDSCYRAGYVAGCREWFIQNSINVSCLNEQMEVK